MEADGLASKSMNTQRFESLINITGKISSLGFFFPSFLAEVKERKESA